MNYKASIDGYKKYIPNISITFMEHIIYSGSNFIITIMLARYLSQTNYGLFVFIFAIYLFTSSLHNAVILEPYSVFFFTRYKENSKEYMHKVLLYSIILASFLGFLSIIITICYLLLLQKNYLIISILFSLFLITGFLDITIRRTFYSLKLYKQILIITFIRMVIAVTLVLLFNYLEILNINSAYLILIIISSIVSVMGIIYLNFNMKDTKQKLIKNNEVLMFHWDYGKWGLLTSIVFWISSQGYLMIIGYFLSLNEIGGFKAIQNILSPLNLFSTAMGTLLITFFSANIKKGIIWISNVANKIADIATIGVTITLLIVFFFRDDIISLLYGGKYSDYSFLLIYLIFSTILTFRTNIFSMVLRSMEKTKEIFISNLLASLATILIGVILIKFLEIKGAAINLIITSCILFMSVNIFYKKAIRAS